jgi:hypothetical protein
MIRSSIHSFATFTGTLGGRLSLRAAAWNVALCPSLDSMNYQQKPGEQDRPELKI